MVIPCYQLVGEANLNARITVALFKILERDTNNEILQYFKYIASVDNNFYTL